MQFDLLRPAPQNQLHPGSARLYRHRHARQLRAGRLPVQLLQQAQGGYGLEKGELWRHSVGCAIASQRIAAQSSEDVSGQAFTAGLLHDIGKIILNAYVDKELPAILKLVESEQLSFCEAEKRVLGFSNTEAGTHVARHWNLPEPLIESIALHQDPTRAKIAPKLVAQVHLGNSSASASASASAPTAWPTRSTRRRSKSPASRSAISTVFPSMSTTTTKRPRN